MKLRYKKTVRLSEQEYKMEAKKLIAYQSHLRRVVSAHNYAYPESSLVVPSDAPMQKEIFQCVQRTVSSRLRYIFLVGIGGSDLGAKAVYDALRGYRDVLGKGSSPQLFFIDTLNIPLIYDIRKLIASIADPAEYLIVIISKSGTTTETIAGTEVLLEALPRHVKSAVDRCVAITDEDSRLWKYAQKNGWYVLAIPPSVGGRYSVFSPVGLFPLAAAGFDIRALCKGALSTRSCCVSRALPLNPSLQSAIGIFLHMKRGYVVHDTFLFSPQLESLGKWYRQLLGESIGKEYDREGKQVGVGIVPTVSIGSTDLHSVGQLYLGGPKNILTTFVRVAHASLIRVPRKGMLHGIVPGIESRPLSQIMDAILDGTKAAYAKRSLPFFEVTLDSVSETELGVFFQWKMIEVMYLAQLLGINAFDQPNVESYKAEARKRLTR
ncbi:MAG: hypothetical protein AAB400_01920 [Patescibacteria group bacterium]|mgnify:CR=1 FL=1